MIKNKAKVLLLAIFLIIVTLGSVSCSNNNNKDSDKNINQIQSGIYFEFKNEEILTAWIELKNDGIWIDSSNASGIYEIKDSSIIIYSKTDSTMTELMRGTIANGFLTLSFMGTTTIYKRVGNSSSNSTDGSNSTTKYTISFDTDGGTTIPDQSIVSGGKVQVPIIPEKDGFIFNKWYSDVTLYYEFNFSIQVDSSRTLYAGYSLDPNRIVYNLNGGTNRETNKQSYTKADTLTLEDPTRNGYVFDGWYTSSNYEGYPFEGVTEISKEPKGVIELFARWYSTETRFFKVEGGYEAELSTSYISNDLIIPGFYKGLPVKNIYTKFSTKPSSTSVYIPNTVETIDPSCFGNFPSLTEVIFEQNSVLNSIGETGFSNCPNLTTIIMPNSLRTIGNSAFSYCTSLISVTIPDGLTSLGNNAFARCPNLTNVIIPNSLTSIDSSTFTECTSLVNVTIPDSIISIGGYAFSKCTSLVDLTIPSSVTSIHETAFRNSTKLGLTWYYNPSVFNSIPSDLIPYFKTVYVVDGVTTLKDNSFYIWSNLENVFIPGSVTSIGSKSFYGCLSLTGITVDESNNSYKSVDGVLYDNNGTLLRYPSKKNGTTFVIPSNISKIAEYSFYNAVNLTSISIPGNITSIGDDAFYSCINLTNVTIDDGVISIGEYSFSRCNNLVSVTLSNSIETIGDQAFSWCSNLEEISIPSSVTSVGRNSFLYSPDLSITWYYNPSLSTTIVSFFKEFLKTVIIPDGVTAIGNSAFMSCSNLTSITIPNSVTTIGTNAFWKCSSLEEIVIPSSILDIQGGAFLYCHGLTSVVIPEGVTTIGDISFSYCINLVDITIPKSVTSIGERVFLGSKKLVNIIVDEENNNYKSVDGVLYDKTGTTLLIYPSIKAINVNIAAGVTQINNYAFLDCEDLISILIPESIEFIDPGVFTDSSSLTRIDVVEENSYYKSIDGVLYDKTVSTIYSYPAGKTESSFEIPASVSIIGEIAFYNCINLVNITIPDGVTIIRPNAFNSCINLENITIPESVQTIGFNAFRSCRSIVSIAIPYGVTTIENNTFYDCASLVSITIPNSVTSIGNSAFYYCINLVNITIPESVESIGTSAFYNCKSLTSIVIPEGVTIISKSLFSDCESLVNVSLPESLITIGDSAFITCKYLVSITIPDSVTTIGNNAFTYCIRLTSITIPSNVTTIGINAFSYCYGLVNIIIPSNVTTIGNKAFSYCSNLVSITVDEDNINYTSIDGVLYDKAVTRLIAYSPKKSDVSFEIPTSVTSIDSYAFNVCPNLTSVIIPLEVTTISSNAFYDCKNLKLNIKSPSQPEGWESDWSNYISNFVWGYTE